MKRILLLILLSCSFSLFAELEYGIDLKKADSPCIKRVMIFAERHSGSNYVECLMRENFPGLRVAFDFGHKHFPPWFSLPREKFLGPSHFYDFAGSEDTLFVVIFRNPYDWLRSLNKSPHHAVQSLKKLDFSTFIRSTWLLDKNDRYITSPIKNNPLIDLDPKTEKPFPNVMHLRTAKIENMLMIKDRVNNIYLLNYEMVRDHPEKVLDEVAIAFGLTRSETFIPILENKGYGPNRGKKFTKESFKPISKNDLWFINSQLKKDVEESIGYVLVDKSGQIK